MELTANDPRRLMTNFAPRGNVRDRDADLFTPVSFGIMDEGLLRFRMVDATGRSMDILLNDVVADAMAACISLRHQWPADRPQREVPG